ncbi:MAG: sigma-E factor negative regulatory protein [Candidatus Cyclonatronum sp.]|uniref:hypothetical protein n=1 Tax=Cyclonatronum sp. TaxID=3024185 RepID=UPI0025C05F22|nr:hypothetical protein [Cyclonatronum sp.]MCC5932627.1 hypothetical protein [Balneolales bacterium]MCH8486011.1 sigma-E factor negative regulatory protein [Cyclonatronum sp.]
MKEKKNLSELITAYVDGELNSTEEKNLLELAAADQDIQTAIKKEQLIKQIVSRHCKKIQAPAHLFDAIQTKLQAEQAETNPFLRENSQAKPRQNRFMMPLAALLVMSLLIFLVQQFMPSENSGLTTYSFEELTYTHFASFDGRFIQPAISPDTTYEAQQYLKNTYGCNITVPELLNTTFVGVTYADFFEGFHTPLLTYQTTDETYIFIFAAELVNLDAHPHLHPLQEAFDTIKAHNDVYIKKFNGHDVVSWKWNDVWYAGISQHDGQILAAMLPH